MEETRKTCGTCKYAHVDTNYEPCIDCFWTRALPRWEQMDEVIERVEHNNNLTETAKLALKKKGVMIQGVNKIMNNTDAVRIVTGEPEEDVVNHPHHYADTCSLECIDVMQITFGEQAVIAFCICNAFKYLWRYKNKNGMEDLNKAGWYLDKARELGGKNEYQESLMDLLKKLRKE